MSARDNNASAVPETLPNPHIIPLQRAPIDDEPPLPPPIFKATMAIAKIWVLR